jgi:hypothetical protein
MLDADLAADLAADELAPGYLRPDYDGFCFTRIPATAASMVGSDLGPELPDRALDGVGTDAERVVVVFLDSLGFRQFERVYEDVSLLESLSTRVASRR